MLCLLGQPEVRCVAVYIFALREILLCGVQWCLLAAVAHTYAVLLSSLAPLFLFSWENEKGQILS